MFCVVIVRKNSRHEKRPSCKTTESFLRRTCAPFASFSGRGLLDLLRHGPVRGPVPVICGVYLLADVIREPLEASETVILTGGFTLAFASFLLTYLVWPRATDFRKRAASRQWHTFRRPVLRAYHEGAHARRHSTHTSEHQRGLM